MNIDFLNNKTNDQIYYFLTGITQFSLEKTLIKIQNYNEKRKNKIIKRILWHIPGGMKVNDIPMKRVIEEYILSYMGGNTDEDILSIVNKTIKKANKKIENNQEDQLTDDEINALAADENKDGKITLSPLMDNTNEILVDSNNSEIQVFE